jgi:glycosyltransferase involved in cell wall biosynthesis
MTNLPRVTIITPSYNQAPFLEETIRSVLSQEYPDLEYIIVDGGSTDGSVEIIQRYAGRLAWWVSEKDRGQADAINKGFARATGEIVAWLNSDDYYLPGAIQAAVMELQNHPEAGMVFGDVVSIDGAGVPFNVMTFGDWGLEELLQFNIIGQPSVFARRSVLEKAGPLDLSLDLLLDVELWMRVALVAPIRYVPGGRWSAARFHAGAKNVSQAPKYGRDAYRVVDRMATDPVLSPYYNRLRRRIWAGACRFDAHYLLDGGLPGAALRAYLRSLWYYPPIALPETRRILYAFVSQFINVGWLKRSYLQRRKDRLKIT